MSVQVSALRDKFVRLKMLLLIFVRNYEYGSDISFAVMIGQSFVKIGLFFQES